MSPADQLDQKFSTTAESSASPSMYTMPEKFLPHTTKRQKSGKGLIIFLYVLIGLVLIGGGAAVWYFFVYQSPASQVPAVTMPPAASPTSTAAIAPTSTEVQTPAPAPGVDVKFVAKDNATQQEIGSVTIKLSSADSALAHEIDVSSLDPSQMSGRARQAIGAIYIFSSNDANLNFSQPTEFVFSYVESPTLTSLQENGLQLAAEQPDGSWQYLDGAKLDIVNNDITMQWNSLPKQRITILSNIDVATPTSTTPTSTIATSTPTHTNPLQPSLDSDHDGLTDVEENLYHSDPHNADTDHDGYLDGSEVVNGYSPISTSTLLADHLVKTYQDTTLNFSVLYPSTWQALPATDNTGNLVTFESGGDDFVQVSAYDNPSNLTALQWYQTLAPNLNISSLQTETVDGYTGVVSPDNSTFYLAVGNKIYVFTYHAGLKTTVDYLTTWRMIYHSFKH